MEDRVYVHVNHVDIEINTAWRLAVLRFKRSSVMCSFSLYRLSIYITGRLLGEDKRKTDFRLIYLSLNHKLILTLQNLI